MFESKQLSKTVGRDWGCILRPTHHAAIRAHSAPVVRGEGSACAGGRGTWVEKLATGRQGQLMAESVSSETCAGGVRMRLVLLALTPPIASMVQPQLFSVLTFTICARYSLHIYVLQPCLTATHLHSFYTEPAVHTYCQLTSSPTSHCTRFLQLCIHGCSPYLCKTHPPGPAQPSTVLSTLCVVALLRVYTPGAVQPSAVPLQPQALGQLPPGLMKPTRPPAQQTCTTKGSLHQSALS